MKFIKTIALMFAFIALAFIALAVIFYFLELATRPDYVIRPGYYIATEVAR